MSAEFEILKDILEKSIEKHGNQNLTIQHLLNMINMAERIVHEDNEDLWQFAVDFND